MVFSTAFVVLMFLGRKANKGTKRRTNEKASDQTEPKHEAALILRRESPMDASKLQGSKCLLATGSLSAQPQFPWMTFFLRLPPHIARSTEASNTSLIFLTHHSLMPYGSRSTVPVGIEGHPGQCAAVLRPFSRECGCG